MNALRRGFTLLEILLVAALIALISTLLCSAYMDALHFSATVEKRAANEVELDRVAEQIRQQLVALNTSPVRLYPVQIGNTGGDRHDQIDFITSDLIQHDGIGDVAYKIDTDPSGREYLAYREHAFVYPDNAPVNPGPFKLLSKLVNGLQVEFQGQAGWVHAWENPLLPPRIRISLWLAGSSEPYVLEAEPALESVTPIGETPGVGPSQSPSPGALSPTPNQANPLTPSNQVTTPVNPLAPRHGAMIILAVLALLTVLYILSVQLGNQILFANHLSNRWLQHEQSYYIVRSIAEQALKLIPPSSQKYNSLQDPWAQPLPPIPIDDKVVAVQIQDEERRFNINAMLNSDGTIDATRLGQFQRLLTSLNASPNFANAVADWLDADSTVRFPGGAEAMQYPNYPCKNGPLDSVAEIAMIFGYPPGLLEGTATDTSLQTAVAQATGLPGLGAAQPSSTPTLQSGQTAGLPGLKYLCTVHSSGTININTANQYVLQCIAPSMPAQVAAAIVQYRQEQPFTSVSGLMKVPGFNLNYLYYFQQSAGVQSSVYSVTATVLGSEGSYRARVYVQLDPNTGQWRPLVWEVHF